MRYPENQSDRSASAGARVRRRWTGLVVIGLLVGCLAAVTLVACGMLFDQEQPPPPQRKVRRDLLKEIEDLKQQVAQGKTKEATTARMAVGSFEEPSAPPPIEKTKTWKEAFDLLPKDEAGKVDWVKAFEAGTIVPRSSVDPKAPRQQVLDLDVDLAPSASRVFAVTFSHGSHTPVLRCRNCHARPFPVRRWGEPTVVTMTKMKAGQYCAVCHGPVAFGFKDECVRCHEAIPEKAQWRLKAESKLPIERAKTWKEVVKLLPVTEDAPDWAKALADGIIAPRPGISPKAEDEEVFPSEVELEPAENSPGKVTFSHESHTAIITCVSCHPEMETSDKKTTFIGTHDTCEKCHDKVAFSMETCGRCHREGE